jgi:malonyl-CoA/methylmalonyl-CoA synthetase
MTDHNMFAALRAAFPQNLDACAIETGEGGMLSWRQLDRATARMANWLDGLRLPPASRVAVQVEKSVEALVLYLATLRAGKVFLPLNPAYRVAELDHFIADAEPAVVICSDANLGWVGPLAARAGIAHVFTLNDNASGTLLDATARYGDAHQIATSKLDDVAAIVYTSGTTGRSKGAMLTHGNMLSNARVLKDYWAWRADDVLIHALPIFHVHGLFVAIHGALINGSKMIWLAKFDPKQVVKKMAGATILMGVPTFYVRLLELPGLDANAARHMRLFISGSAPMLSETFHEWDQRTGHKILERYGMSETIMLASNPCRPEDGGRLAGTVGKPLPTVEIRIVGSDDNVLDAGAIGAIQVRGPNVFPGYWRMPEKTAEEFAAGGWFRTGDVGAFGPDGYLRIVGRSKDLIISGGLNVYPAEIEGLINELAGVEESAVVGVAHSDFGEVGVAFVKPKHGFSLDVETILSSLKLRMANFKVPKTCFVVDHLPRNAMGKVQKNILRQLYKSNSQRPIGSES